jgi:hypothetical protein
MNTIVVYSPHESSRLRYVLDWLFTERLHLSYALTTNEQDVLHLPAFISYGRSLGKGLSIPDCGLLWQQGTDKADFSCGTWNDIPTIFASEGVKHTVPFDMLSAIFFLLSRYEEYYTFTPDKHGRYPATDSILYKKSMLRRPVVDEWVHGLGDLLRREFGVNVRPALFTYQPTYDIDIAYSYLYKGISRMAGAYLRAIIKADVRQIRERIRVSKRKQKDPYDSYRWLRQLHKHHQYKPIYFVLCADNTTAFDKNIHPQHPAMMRVIRNFSKEGVVGIHPSYFADRNAVMTHEKQVLENISGQPVAISRQHYIKVKMPDTYRLLLQNGITDDYSMGYGAHLGFRAGTGSAFPWYDLQQETITTLRIHPFCFMDTTAHYERKYNAAKAFDKLNEMTRLLEQTGSTLITVFHNFSLGTAYEWKGWRHHYEQFLQERGAV